MTTKERPTFLTVLCILTFVGTGLLILSNLTNLAMAPVITAVSEMAIEEAGDDMEIAMEEMEAEIPAFAELFKNMFGAGMAAVENFRTIVLVKLVCLLIILVGAILMWKLNKVGFYLFAGAKVVMIATLFALLGANGFAFLMVLGSLVVSGAFITMYAVNLKAMD